MVSHGFLCHVIPERLSTSFFRCPWVCVRGKEEGKGGEEEVFKMLRNVLALRNLSQRTISTTSCRQIKNKVPEYQKLFQEDNGLPVYLKGGIMDALLYRATMALTIFGTGYVLYELFMAAMPKKQK